MTDKQKVPSIAVASTKRIIDGKRCLVTAVTRADQYRVGDVWYSAKGIEHGTFADEVSHFNRYKSVKGSTVRANPWKDEPSIDIQILSIRAVDPRRLPPDAFPPLGYIDYDDYMSEWGKVFGNCVWLLAIKPIIAPKVSGDVQ